MLRKLGVLLFEDFELLDVFGPLEAVGNLKEAFEIMLVAAAAGPVASAQGPRSIADVDFASCPRLDVLLVPGGRGTRREVDNRAVVEFIATTAKTAELVLSVCTGAALLARAGLLDGRRATTNKRSFRWVTEQGPRTEWVEQARWVEDGNVWTSSGVSAGIDMTLALIARLLGKELAEAVAVGMEYVWQPDASTDPFARHHASGTGQARQND